jgi:hypothetical protein
MAMQTRSHSTEVSRAVESPGTAAALTDSRVDPLSEGHSCTAESGRSTAAATATRVQTTQLESHCCDRAVRMHMAGYSPCISFTDRIQVIHS